MAELVYPAPFRALDALGNPVPGAPLRAFRTGTTTPLTLFADEAGTTPHPVPLLADANGIFPMLVNTSAFDVKIDVTDPATGASLPGYPINRALSASSSIGAAETISFAPTAELPYTNVQQAVDQGIGGIIASKTGEDVGIVSGTAGSNGRLSQWNVDGDLVQGPAYGTSGADALLQLDGDGRLPAIDIRNATNVPTVSGAFTTPTRAVGTAYTNDLARLRFVAVDVESSLVAAIFLEASSDSGVTWRRIAGRENVDNNNAIALSAMIIPTHQYRVTVSAGTATINAWVEV